MYPLIIVAYAFLALIGWRVARRFGARGLSVFLGILTVVGTLHDFLIAGGLMGLVVFALCVASDAVHVHDFQATLLYLLGIAHKRLTFRFQGRDFRLIDVHGDVVRPVLA
jgi:hypothetical protein